MSRGPGAAGMRWACTEVSADRALACRLPARCRILRRGCSVNSNPAVKSESPLAQPQVQSAPTPTLPAVGFALRSQQPRLPWRRGDDAPRPRPFQRRISWARK